MRMRVFGTAIPPPGKLRFEEFSPGTPPSPPSGAIPHKLANKSMGWLAQQVMSTWSSNPTLSEQYSWAIWEIFAFGANKDVIKGNSNIGDAKAQDALWEIVASHISDAAVAVQNADLSDVYVYTPTLSIQRGTVPQEFFFVPEASTPAFLVFNLLALPGVLFLLRRRCLRR
jgi:hypothetical protein